MSILARPTGTQYARTKQTAASARVAVPSGNKTQRSPGGITAPTDLPNLAAWYSATQGITIATGVSQWNDLSGNGRHLVQATGAKQPLFVASAQNGLPAVQSDGITQELAATFTLNQPEHIFTVHKYMNAFSAVDVLFDGNGGGGSLMAVWRSAADTMAMVASGSPVSGTGFTPQTMHIGEWAFNGASSYGKEDVSQRITGTPGTNNGGGIRMFIYGGGTSPAAAQMCEFIVYSRYLSVAEAANVRSYLKAKWATP